MKNKNIIRKITQGVYVLTTKEGGCIVDAVSQVSAGDNPLITVSVMKNNYTNQLMKKNSKFALSVLGKDVNPKIIQVFGMNSMRDINKFDKVSTKEMEEIKIIDDSLGYMICEIVDSIENETHTLFIGRLIESDMYKDEEAMSYQYYQENKSDFIKIENEKMETIWICTVCGYIYHGDELPDDYRCPKCGVPKDLFKKQG